MPVEWRSTGTIVTGNLSATTSAAVGTPSGFQSGDLLLSFFNIGQFAGSAVNFPSSIPSGWTLLGTATSPATVGSAVYYKIASGSEGATQTWSGFSIAGQSSWYYHWQMLAFTGVDATTPIPASEWAKTTNTTTTAAQTHPSVTPTVAGSGLALYRIQYQSSGTARTFTSSITSAGAPAGVERSDPSGTSVPQMCIYTRDGGFALAAQSYTTTASGTGNGGQHMWSITLRSDGVNPPTGPGDSVGVLLA